MIPEFLSFVAQYDIIGIQESKLDDVDRVNIPLYQVFANNRARISRYRSGGIAILVKNELYPFITIQKVESKLISWLAISNQILPTDDDLYCGIVYIPPYRSKFAHDDPYLELQAEVDKYMAKSKNILMFGDFNSRTGSKADYIICDQFMCDIQGNEELFLENLNTINYFDNYDVSLKRNNADTTDNFYGQQLLNFCKYNNIFIINGRFCSDKFSPKTTCKDKSTIDYFLSTVLNFPYFNSFEVLEFDSLYSDAHCGVKLSINALSSDINHAKHCKDNSPTPRLWEESKAHRFEENISETELNTISECFENLKHQPTTQKQINEIVTKIENMFASTAKKTFGFKKLTQNENSNHKKWFNQECRGARNLYHNARKLYNKHKTLYFKNALKTVSKEYKSTISKAVKNFKKQRVDKLRNLKTLKPRDYWKIINSVDKHSSSLPPLNELHAFFKELNSAEKEQTKKDEHAENNFENLNEINIELNQPITQQEVLQAVKKLKNNKSSGPDCILNEHIKSTINLLLPTYTQLFNTIFDTGIFPESWALGDILPIYKNKGSLQLPENYRPITLLSCLGKLFTSVLNNRISTYVEKYEIICHNQAGFRKGLSTTDNLFVIQSLIDIAKSYKHKLFCAFIDFKQAFDNVWRDGLWYKVGNFGINGKCLNLIKNMYNNIKSRIITPEGNSAFFPCCKGVRQGENLSPILFSLFLNDLEHYLMANKANGIVCEANTENTYSFIKVLILLFADDTVLFANNNNDLQIMLNIFEKYCEDWKLTVNVSKTKILIFSSDRSAQTFHFYFKGIEIDIVTEYKYLGIYLSKNGSYLNCKKHVAEQANNAIFALMRKIRVLNLPIEMQIELFNKLIKPILLYGCEIWAFGNLDIIERVQLKFLKRILHLKKSTPSYMVYGETGVMPLKVEIQSKIVSYWSNLLEFNTGRLSSMIYNILYILFEQGKCKSKWLENVKNIVSSNGYANVWESQSCLNKNWFRASFKQKLKDQFLQRWESLLNSSSGAVLYRMYKNEFGINKYFYILNNNQCRTLTAFRTRNHRLPVELGSWGNTKISERKCTFCHSEVGDEFHCLFNCTYFTEERNFHIKNYYRKNPNSLKMNELMNSTNASILKHLTQFAEKIMKAHKFPQQLQPD